jgi:hypothetical protein
MTDDVSQDTASEKLFRSIQGLDLRDGPSEDVEPGYQRHRI